VINDGAGSAAAIETQSSDELEPITRWVITLYESVLRLLDRVLGGK
jgi:hypothetical protein